MLLFIHSSSGRISFNQISCGSSSQEGWAHGRRQHTEDTNLENQNDVDFQKYSTLFKSQMVTWKQIGNAARITRYLKREHLFIFV